MALASEAMALINVAHVYININSSVHEHCCNMLQRTMPPTWRDLGIPGAGDCTSLGQSSTRANRGSRSVKQTKFENKVMCIPGWHARNPETFGRGNTQH